jgi:hypothetical protein
MYLQQRLHSVMMITVILRLFLVPLIMPAMLVMMHLTESTDDLLASLSL